MITSILAAERAADELRRQMGVVIQQDNQNAQAIFPAEFLDEMLLNRLRATGGLRLTLSAERTESLGLGHAAASIDAQAFSLQEINSLANPLMVRQAPAASPRPASHVEQLAITLAKRAGLLPAMLISKFVDDHWLTYQADALAQGLAAQQNDVMETARAALPLEGGTDATIISFRARYATSVHLALVIGAITDGEPLVRVHSSCVTGDLLGSLRCDCGDQLRLALARIKEAGQGILLYLHQEGRGIGITNKLRAYGLQQQGIDTYIANRQLGFADDERDFAVAGAILRAIGASSIRLLTNNPQKLARLEKAGIRVSQRVALVAAAGEHNKHYLKAKAEHAGHWLES